jgi:multidrug efflux pump subunit AcrB
MSVQESTTQAAPYVLDVRLADGDQITLEAGTDVDSAESELAALHSALETGAFVRLGDVAIVRAAEIRSARVHRLGGDESFHDVLQPRTRGSRMTTYDP